VVAAIRPDLPAVPRLVEDGGGHPRLELDIPAQVETVRHVVDIGEDLRLGGVALGPLPLLLQIVRERVGVVHALDVAAGARVAVPVPGAADSLARLEDARREAEPAQPVQRIESREAGADDHRVQLARRRRLSH
jgi:hypothetical protein